MIPLAGAQDIAKTYFFFVSDLACFIAGESLVLNGALSIHPPGSATSRLTGLDVLHAQNALLVALIGNGE